MAKSKRFQSGREIFEVYIPDYVTEGLDVDNDAGHADKVVDAILCDFYTRVPETKGSSAKDGARSQIEK